jgi:hypothetical protein
MKEGALLAFLEYQEEKANMALEPGEAPREFMKVNVPIRIKRKEPLPKDRFETEGDTHYIASLPESQSAS